MLRGVRARGRHQRPTAPSATRCRFMGADYTFAPSCAAALFRMRWRVRALLPADGRADLAAHSPSADAGPERPRRSAAERVDHVVERAGTLPLTDAWWNAPQFFPCRSDRSHFSEHLLGLAPITTPIILADGRTAARLQRRHFFSRSCCARWPRTSSRLHHHASARRRVRRRAGVHVRALPDGRRSRTYRCCRRTGCRSRWRGCTGTSRCRRRRNGLPLNDDGRGWCCSPARG